MGREIVAAQLERACRAVRVGGPAASLPADSLSHVAALGRPPLEEGAAESVSGTGPGRFHQRSPLRVRSGGLLLVSALSRAHGRGEMP